MGYRLVALSFTMSREQFTELLLLKGTIEVEATEPITGDNPRKISLNGIGDHTKRGMPGIEDGSNHFFKTSAIYEGHFCETSISANSQDGGQTYSGGMTIKVYPADPWSE